MRGPFRELPWWNVCSVVLYMESNGRCCRKAMWRGRGPALPSPVYPFLKTMLSLTWKRQHNQLQCSPNYSPKPAFPGGLNPTTVSQPGEAPANLGNFSTWLSNSVAGETSPKRDFSAFLRSEFSQSGFPALVQVNLDRVTDVFGSRSFSASWVFLSRYSLGNECYPQSAFLLKTNQTNVIYAPQTSVPGILILFSRVSESFTEFRWEGEVGKPGLSVIIQTEFSSLKTWLFRGIPHCHSTKFQKHFHSWAILPYRYQYNHFFLNCERNEWFWALQEGTEMHTR